MECLGVEPRGIRLVLAVKRGCIITSENQYKRSLTNAWVRRIAHSQESHAGNPTSGAWPEEAHLECGLRVTSTPAKLRLSSGITVSAGPFSQADHQCTHGHAAKFVSVHARCGPTVTAGIGSVRRIRSAPRASLWRRRVSNHARSPPAEPRSDRPVGISYCRSWTCEHVPAKLDSSAS